MLRAKISQDVDKLLTFLKKFFPYPAWVSAIRIKSGLIFVTIMSLELLST